MVRFNTTILKFGEQGEKTGWSYILITEELAQQLNPGNKKSFRVKGKLDEHPFAGIALMPMGDGTFIMALKASVRKAIRKRAGDTLTVMLEVDETPFTVPEDFMECLNDEPKALEYFNKLPAHHKKYFINWIESAKTFETKTKRMAQAVTALSKQMHYGLMIRSLKENRG